MNAMQATLDAGAANAASALTQIDNLNSEPAAAMAERFKLVATVMVKRDATIRNVFLGRQDQERGGEDQRCQSPRT